MKCWYINWACASLIISYNSWKGLLQSCCFFLCCYWGLKGGWFWISTIFQSSAFFLARVNPFPKFKAKKSVSQNAIHRWLQVKLVFTCIHLSFKSLFTYILCTITKISADLKVTLGKIRCPHCYEFSFFFSKSNVFVYLSICWALFDNYPLCSRLWV